jgi:hypothetical protein
MGGSQFKASLGKKKDPVSENKLGMVMHACKPSYAGGRGRWSAV